VHNLAWLYEDLGRFDEAEALYLDALAGDDGADAITTVNNLAWLLEKAGRFEESERRYREGLAQDPDHDSLLDGLGVLLSRTDRVEEAIEVLTRSLALREARDGADHPDVVTSLQSLAEAHRLAGDLDEATVLLARALPLAFSRGTPSHRWIAASAQARLLADLDRRPEAILWAKLAVNELQAVRENLGTNDTASRSGFVERNEGAYRLLLELLVQEGRLAEAEQVVRLLKEAEHSRFMGTQRSGGAELALSAEEADLVALFTAVRESVVDANRERFALARRQGRGDALSKAELERLDQLEGQVRAANAMFDATVSSVERAFTAGERATEHGDLGLEGLENMQLDLDEEVGPGHVLLTLVVLDDHVELLLTTPEARVAERAEVDRATLTRAIVDFRDAIQSRQDPRAQAKQLYDWLIGPVESHLEQAETVMLMLTPDAQLRYVPFAALHDGEQWLVEKWPISTYIPAVGGDPLRDRGVASKVVAFGLSQSVEFDGVDLNALPAVPAELDAIVLAEGEETGAVDGRWFLDEDFTRLALGHALETDAAMVHVASHFMFRPGSPSDSFLALGDGTRLSIKDLGRWEIKFRKVDLLTLSACDTAVAVTGAHGTEVESLAVAALGKGARAVLASLWPVADASTAEWMADMYARRVEDRVSKAEAVRQTQLAFIGGEGTDESGSRGAPLVVPESGIGLPDDLEGWRHPYYWAPFVLMGNWR
jgi:CHAT domain-containing protein